MNSFKRDLECIQVSGILGIHVPRPPQARIGDRELTTKIKGLANDSAVVIDDMNGGANVVTFQRSVISDVVKDDANGGFAGKGHVSPQSDVLHVDSRRRVEDYRAMNTGVIVKIELIFLREVARRIIGVVGGRSLNDSMRDGGRC